VLITFENEAVLIDQRGGRRQVRRGLSVAVHRRLGAGGDGEQGGGQAGTRKQATAYLNFLYSPEGQEIIAKHHFRPRDPAVAKKYASPLPGGEDLHGRREVRQLGRGAEDPLRRWRRV
jgi:sulfate transport system substrate-binding protein